MNWRRFEAMSNQVAQLFEMEYVSKGIPIGAHIPVSECNREKEVRCQPLFWRNAALTLIGDFVRDRVTSFAELPLPEPATGVHANRVSTSRGISVRCHMDGEILIIRAAGRIS